VNAKDRHVLKAAIHHDVDFIVTNDSRLQREITAWIASGPRKARFRRRCPPTSSPPDLSTSHPMRSSR
jgi:hypothetical protein